jgi:hypothetical protein
VPKRGQVCAGGKDRLIRNERLCAPFNECDSSIGSARAAAVLSDCTIDRACDCASTSSDLTLTAARGATTGHGASAGTERAGQGRSPRLSRAAGKAFIAAALPYNVGSNRRPRKGGAQRHDALGRPRWLTGYTTECAAHPTSQRCSRPTRKAKTDLDEMSACATL